MSKEHELYFMVGDVPIPFGSSVLTLPINFKAIENKHRALDPYPIGTIQKESQDASLKGKFANTVTIQSIGDDKHKKVFLEKPN